jgi:hypothetical protein
MGMRPARCAIRSSYRHCVGGHGIGAATIRAARDTPSTWPSSSSASRRGDSLRFASARARCRQAATVAVDARASLGWASMLAAAAVAGLVELVERQVDAVIGDAALREIIGADALGAVAGADLQLARLRLLTLLFALGVVAAASAAATSRARGSCAASAVLHSTTMPVGNVGDADRRVGLVDVLAAGALRRDRCRCAGPRSLIRRLDFLDLGQDRDGAGRGVDAPLRLGGRHALHAMHAGFEFQLGEGAAAR